jgi:hypothetical protein
MGPPGRNGDNPRVKTLDNYGKTGLFDSYNRKRQYYIGISRQLQFIPKLYNRINGIDGCKHPAVNCAALTKN